MNLAERCKTGVSVIGNSTQSRTQSVIVNISNANPRSKISVSKKSIPSLQKLSYYFVKSYEKRKYLSNNSKTILESEPVFIALTVNNFRTKFNKLKAETGCDGGKLGFILFCLSVIFLFV